MGRDQRGQSEAITLVIRYHHQTIRDHHWPTQTIARPPTVTITDGHHTTIAQSWLDTWWWLAGGGVQIRAYLAHLVTKCHDAQPH